MQEYYTYLDVLDRLRDLEPEKRPPAGTVRADATPTRLAITISANTNLQQVMAWLKETFGPRYSQEGGFLSLETAGEEQARRLAIDIVRSDDENDAPVKVRLRPTLSKSRFVAFENTYEPLPKDSLAGLPPVMTFHSFKGGMGRTTLALAFADSLSRGNHKVLFVDGDFEAPGISSMLRHIMPAPRVSFADLLALAHADPDPLAKHSIQLVAERLVDQEVEGIVVLPCTRDLSLPHITPEALTFSPARSPFFVGDILAKLAQLVGADLVIVDLRAGLSELAASLFLDPRLEHVLVTTLNGQAIDGTIALLNESERAAMEWRKATGEALMGSLTVVVNQAPSGITSGGPSSETIAANSMTALDDALRRISEKQSDSASSSSANPFFDSPLVPLIIESTPAVAILPRDLSAARRLLAEHFTHREFLDKFIQILPEKEPPPAQTIDAPVSDRRRKLADYAKGAVFAESGARQEIFPTRSLMNLVDRHQRSLPTIVVLGDKGAGKTYTFMSLALSRTWRQFAGRVSPSAVVVGDDLILPVTPPQDLGEGGRASEREITRQVATAVSGLPPLNDQRLSDVIERQKASDGSESLSSWRDFWLDLIAWRCGIDVEVAGAFQTLVATHTSRRLVAIFDGIETLFTNIKSSIVERTAVEALLRAVPDWLAQLPDRPLGTLIFIREDVARAALPNNFKQFEDRYGAYALKWNWSEASALAFWIAQQAGALDSTRSPIDLVEMDEETRGRELEALWGLKMGPNTSREARSQEWVMSSLSDFNRRVKARDLVRFMFESSQRSTDDQIYYDNRILSPRAMRDSIDPCSEARVVETGEENNELRQIFERIRQLTSEQRELPWRLEDAIQFMGAESVRALDENGVLFRDRDEYYVPEIYRHGLRFYYSGGARRKVVTLMRRAPVYE